jgi:hypothetical protein
MSFGELNGTIEQYPAEYYREFLDHIRTTYEGQYWHALPRDVARHVKEAGQKESRQGSEVLRPRKALQARKRQKIWIDLDNSPHVPLFKPIIDELGQRGYDCMVTARDCFQVNGLVDLHGVKCKTIGRHYGKHTLLKLFGLVYRGMQLAPAAMKDRPALALSHGSRSQHLASLLMGIPTIIMNDYEHVKMLPFSSDTWILTPNIYDALVGYRPVSHLDLTRAQEDVYVPEFVPDPPS